MTGALASASCGNHPQVGAVEICSRCGGFLCGECVLYVREVVPVCASCKPFVENDGPPSRAAWLSPPLGLLGLGLLLAGFVVKGRSGLALWGTGLPFGALGLFLSVRELRRIATHHAPHRGRGLARAGLVLSVLFSLVALALLGAFTLFLRRSLERGG